MNRLILLLVLSLSLLLSGCGDETIAPKAEQDAAEQSMTELAGGIFTTEEFDRFLKNIPQITKLTNPVLETGKEVTPEEVTQLVLETAQSLGWNENRFMYVYSQTMTVFGLDQVLEMEKQIETQMKGLTEEQQQSMRTSMEKQFSAQKAKLQKQVDTQVSPEEQQIIRAKKDELYQALGLK